MTSTQPPSSQQPARQDAQKPVDTFADLASLGKSLVTQPKAPAVAETQSMETANVVPSQNNTTPVQGPSTSSPAVKTGAPTVLPLKDVFVSLESILPGW